MTTGQLRKELKERIDHLRADRLASAADYLAFLDECANPVAARMHERIKRAEKQIARGQQMRATELQRKY